MQSLRHLAEAVYSTAFLRAYRSRQYGLQPHAEDVARAVDQGWMIQSEPEGCDRNPATAQAKPRVGFDKTTIVQAWLEQTEGWTRVRASYDEGRIYAATSIMALAEQCEWASLEDVSTLPLVHQGKMHSVGLELGWGDRNAAYGRDPDSPAAKVYFFNAYHFDHQQN